jgi:hypothetical protein
MIELPDEMDRKCRKRGVLQDFCAIYGNQFAIEWNKLYKRGQLPRMCKKFNLTYNQVCVVRRMLHLPKIHKTTARAKIKWKFNKAAYKKVNIHNLATHYGCSVSFIQNNKSVNYLERKNDTAKTKAVLANPKEFKDFWHQAKMKKGYYKKVMKKFGLTWGSVLYIKKTLHLRDVGVTKIRRDIEAKICRLYVDRNLSSEQVGKRVRMCSELVRIILAKHKIPMKPAHVTNAMYFKTRSGIKPEKLLREIKRLYLVEKLTVVKTAEALGVDAGTITSKLRAMKIPIRSNNHQLMEAGYPCQWCGKMMEKVWQNKGPRKQLYCNNKCKNKAKDLRRMMTGSKEKSQTRVDMMMTELKAAWGDQFNAAYLKLFDAKPCVDAAPRGKKNETITQGLDIQD